MAPTYAGMSGKRLSLSISTIGTLGFLLFGYDQGVMSGIISDAAFNDVFTATKGNSTMQALVTAVYELGCLAGAIFALFRGDMIGRRWMIIIGASVMILGVIIQVTAFPGHVPLAQFMVGRIVTGIGNGGTIAIGTLIAYWIDYGAHFGPSDLVWRFPIAFQVVFGILIIVGMYYLPDSPRYLITRNKIEDGEYVLAALIGHEITDHETQIQKQLVLDSVRASGALDKDVRYKDLLTGGHTQHFRRMLIGASSQIFQQLSGCNAVIYYLPVLLEQSLGQSTNQALLIGGINMICYAVFATFSWFFIEKIGRRKLFLGGTFGQLAAMIITFACLIPNNKQVANGAVFGLLIGGINMIATPSCHISWFFIEKMVVVNCSGRHLGQLAAMIITFACLIPNNKQVANGAVFGLFLYMCFFGATWLPLPWLYPAEISPIKTRAKANAVSTCCNWLFNFTIVMITPVMVSSIGWRTYLFFAVMNASFIPFIWLFYPETSGRSLEEIDIIFAKGYAEKKSYVTAARELPKLTDDDVDAQAVEFGLVRNSDEETEKQIEEKRSSGGAPGTVNPVVYP
uniref:Sugar transporter STL1 n=1 Tax=Talaromyces marneffei PM1 TaxID=1077442 RepID=A0A093V852_TALMA